MNKQVIMVFAWVLALAGAALAAGPTAAPTGPVVIDRTTQNKALNDYTLLTRDAIQAAWSSPLDLNGAAPVKGRISINYSIARDGRLEAIELVRGSGNPELDGSLLVAIRTAAPFPPFPDAIAAPRVLIRASFVIADVPSVPVTTVSQPLDETAAAEKSAKEPNRSTYRWGVPAGTAYKKGPTTSVKNSIIPAPPLTKKYQWGLEK